ncbi:MAG: hypothetical protein WBD45_18170 [Terriglobales bacterium]
MLLAAKLVVADGVSEPINELLPPLRFAFTAALWHRTFPEAMGGVGTVVTELDV